MLKTLIVGNVRLWVHVTPGRGSSNEYPHKICFGLKIRKTDIPL